MEAVSDTLGSLPRVPPETPDPDDGGGPDPGHAATPTGRLYRRGLRLLATSVATHPWSFAASVVGAATYGAAAVVSTLVLGRVTDDVILPAFAGGTTAERIRGAAAAVVGVGLLRAVGIVTRRWFAAMTVARMQVTWRRRITDRYLRVPLAWLRSRSTGTLLAHADADVQVATEVLNPLPFTIGVVVLVAVALASLVVIDVWLAMVAVATFPALALCNHIYTRAVEGPAARVQAAVGAVSAVAHESIDGALVVRTLGRQEAETRRLAAAADELRRARLHVGRLRGTFEPALDALPALGVVAVVAVGTWRVDAGAASTGDVVTAMAMFSLLAFPMRVVGYLLEEMPRSVVAADRLRRVLAAPDEPTPPSPVPLPEGPLDLRAAGCSFFHDGEAVLEGVDLEVPAGSVVALVGPTGSGKTTLCLLLAGLERPHGGRVLIGGVDAAEVEPTQLRRAVALVFQETFLFAGSIRDNLVTGTGAEPSDAEIDEALRLAQAGFVHRLPAGLETPVGERGVTLSGGQRQRLALARALLRRPRVLIADDATSAVDPVVESRILDGLRTRRGITTVMVAHRLSTIRLADRVVLLEAGRVTASGTHDELMELPGYRRLVTAYEQGEPREVPVGG